MKKPIYAPKRPIGLYKSLANENEVRTIYKLQRYVWHLGQPFNGPSELLDDQGNTFTEQSQLPDKQLVEFATDQVWEIIASSHV